MATKKMKILIIGDSFAAKYNGAYLGWSEMLEKENHVTNLAQAGVGEYKILKQVTSVDVRKFDCVIISHTSPYRIHTLHHPLHTEGIHKHCDFIYEDVKGRLPDVENFFTKYFDLDYANHVYKYIYNEIMMILKDTKFIDTTDVGLKSIFETHRGSVQHLNEKGNKIFYKRIIEKIKIYSKGINNGQNQ